LLEIKITKQAIFTINNTVNRKKIILYKKRNKIKLTVLFGNKDKELVRILLNVHHTVGKQAGTNSLAPPSW
jgi:hypothetical protein